MHEYRVIDMGLDDNQMALQDHEGQYHVARVLNLPPSVGATLIGTGPHLGFGFLRCPQSGQFIRVIFEKVNSMLAPSQN